ncbi:SDR family oxidoreductase [Chryseolinea lacunae]|uniref:SDR family oxidoreductase n=1 Tax=Chryseolinea lacunae TaxID=2801331 RepID=A0ABS1KM72_9BACT|nr:SDR family oxidoreductase [Chryseolinea lacunae]MBL0740568.1 SDR family oxidoreductase [Chryseolinea lacunae]
MSQVILVTGTSTGMGKLTALTLAKAGHTTIAAMRDTKGKNQAVAKELAAVRNIEVLDFDVTSDQSVEDGIGQVISKHGKIDVVVNNAGVAGFGVAEAYTLDQVRKMFDVNFYGVYRTYQAVLPHMRSAKSGLIINLSTGASGFTLPFMVPYFASKFAMESLVEGFDLELKPYNIENVSIASGVYPTEMNNGSKAGIGANKEAIVVAYGEEATKRFEAMGGALFGKMADFNMNPQTVADGILNLIEMPKGTRPLRIAMDAVALGADQEFMDTRAAMKDKWVKNYGFPF